MRKHLVWFPFLVMALSMVLGATIVLWERERVPREVGASAGDDEHYRESMRVAMAPVWGVKFVYEDVATVRAVRDAVVLTRVPDARRDTHLRVVIALDVLERALRERRTDLLENAKARLDALQTDIVWLR